MFLPHMLSLERCAGECIGSLDIFVMKEYELHAAQLETKCLLLGIILGIEECKYEISVQWTPNSLSANYYCV